MRLSSLPIPSLHRGGRPITEDRRLILLDRWFLGLTRSLCLAAELSRQEENSGGWLKSATGARLPSNVREETVASLMWSGDGGRDEDTKIFMVQRTNTPNINLVTKGGDCCPTNSPVACFCAIFGLYLGKNIFNWLLTENVLEYLFRANGWEFKGWGPTLRPCEQGSSTGRLSIATFTHETSPVSSGVEGPADFTQLVRGPAVRSQGCRS